MNGTTAPARFSWPAASPPRARLRPDQAQAAYSTGGGRHAEVKGNGASDKLALRPAGRARTLQVDVGEDGTADFSFDRSTFTAIDVEAGGGDDEVRIDQSGGRSPTSRHDERRRRRRHADRRRRRGQLRRRRRRRLRRRQHRRRHRLAGRRRRPLPVGSRRRQRHRRRRGRQRPARLQRLERIRGDHVAANGGRAVLTRNVADITMDLDGLEPSICARSAAPTSPVGDLGGTDLRPSTSTSTRSEAAATARPTRSSRAAPTGRTRSRSARTDARSSTGSAPGPASPAPRRRRTTSTRPRSAA